MTYEIKTTVIIDNENYSLGFYKDYHGEWVCDSDAGFGNISVNALTGPLGEAAKQIINKHKGH